MTEAAVTVLLPTYNRAYFLPYAIRSVLNQSYPHFRLVILDDASPDNTAEVVQPFLADSRVSYVRHSTNQGITGNWRAGIALVETEFFCFLEDDDIFLPLFLERLLAPLRQDAERILSFCDHWAIDAEGVRSVGLTESMSQRFGRHRLQEGVIPDFAYTAVIDGSIGITATLFRSAYITTSFIRDEASGGIDYWLLYQCARTHRAAYYISERLMEYRLHGAGMSHTMPERMAVGHLFLYEQILGEPEVAPLHGEARKKLHTIATSFGIHLLLSGRNDEAQVLLRRALEVGTSLRARVSSRLSRSGTGCKAAFALRRVKQQLSAVLLVPAAQTKAIAVSCFARFAGHRLFSRN